MRRKLLALLLAAAMVFSFAGCGEEDVSSDEEISYEAEQDGVFDEDETKTSVVAEDGTWAIYWYLCGSDLETNGAFATGDLSEMLEVQLPENVKVKVKSSSILFSVPI